MSTVLLVVVLVIAFLGFAYALYSRRGSDIGSHPISSDGGRASSAPQADAPDAADDTGEDDPLSTHGTR